MFHFAVVEKWSIKKVKNAGYADIQREKRECQAGQVFDEMMKRLIYRPAVLKR
ncbi:hypothetical protein EMIT091MI3_60153 [Kosakonia quasisacchari]